MLREREEDSGLTRGVRLGGIEARFPGRIGVSPTTRSAWNLDSPLESLDYQKLALAAA